mgnify:CR=1 FL=1
MVINNQKRSEKSEGNQKYFVHFSLDQAEMEATGPME